MDAALFIVSAGQLEDRITCAKPRTARLEKSVSFIVRF